MYKPSIWSAELNQSRRDYVANVLLSNYGKPLHMIQIAAIVGDITHEPVPAYMSNKAFHSSKYRRLLTSDIDALNRDPAFRWAIISDNSGIRLCNAADFHKLYNMERKEAVKKLAKLAILARKVGLDGQLSITGDKIEAVVREGGAA